MSEFVILKAFKVNIHHSTALPLRIVEVIQHPPFYNWLKCNIDGTALGNPGQVACAGIFRNNHVEYIGCFAMNLGVDNALFDEIMRIILAIECAIERNSSTFFNMIIPIIIPTKISAHKFK
jgi:hypothetical protein